MRHQARTFYDHFFFSSSRISFGPVFQIYRPGLRGRHRKKSRIHGHDSLVKQLERPILEA